MGLILHQIRIRLVRKRDLDTGDSGEAIGPRPTSRRVSRHRSPASHSAESSGVLEEPRETSSVFTSDVPLAETLKVEPVSSDDERGPVDLSERGEDDPDYIPGLDVTEMPTRKRSGRVSKRSSSPPRRGPKGRAGDPVNLSAKQKHEATTKRTKRHSKERKAAVEGKDTSWNGEKSPVDDGSVEESCSEDVKLDLAATDGDDLNVMAAGEPGERSAEFVCRFCKKRFKKLGYLNEHMKNHLNMREYQCPQCDKAFNTKNILKMHMLVHESVGQHVCEICHKSFKRLSTMKIHIQGHLNQREFRCTECGKEFNARTLLTMHMKTHENTGKFACAHCKKVFRREYTMKVHSHKCLQRKPYKCGTCGEKFTHEAEKREHLVLHREERNFACEYCGKMFKDKHGLSMHLMIHQNKRSHVCKHCSKGFNTSSALAMHLRCHIETKQFACEVCGKLLKHRGSLYIHMQVHQEDNPFVCEFCGRAFPSTWRLGQHKKDCANECNICKEVINGGRGALRKHKKLHPVAFQCPTCDKRFTASHGLKQHMKSHLNERAYLCSICGKGFNRRDNRENHVQRVHKETGAGGVALSAAAHVSYSGAPVAGGATDPSVPRVIAPAAPVPLANSPVVVSAVPTVMSVHPHSAAVAVAAMALPISTGAGDV